MKILLLSKYSRKGASTRLRSLQYLPFLEAEGFQITVSSLFDDQYLDLLYKHGKRAPLRTVMLYVRRLFVLLSVFRYDLIWIEKEIFPYLPALAERILHWLGKRYVVDYDDAIFHNYDLSGNSVLRRALGRKIDVVMRYARCVVAGNDYLAGRAKTAGAVRVELVPTVVDATRYNSNESSPAAKPVIGWIGSPSTQSYVVGMARALTSLCQKHNARLLLVGASDDIVSEFPGLDVEVVPWSEAFEAELIAQMDIGIMPLSDGPWEKGKCGYKLIQYMAGGIPVIASPVGVNVDIVGANQCGLLAANTAEWEVALDKLLESPAQRLQLGKAGRKAVETQYSLAVQAPVLAGIFTQSVVLPESV
ncbi:glycosyl transferase family 1 [Marinobacter guineae]|uniref:Glycosyl transferase family 1 n=1 Tax=Marinobacter guineae TaxID=432303 RepID=A0A2G1VJM8_9GAMM|nr:glycosyltransferase family 4 protein [Marinobacter guineae]PHQ26780.1 glycosyl transferase family 1 [Marinobacter guineae]